MDGATGRARASATARLCHAEHADQQGSGATWPEKGLVGETWFPPRDGAAARTAAAEDEAAYRSADERRPVAVG